MLAVVLNRLALAPPGDQVERLIGHCGTGEVVGVVAEGLEVLLDPQPGAERHPAAAEGVEGVQRPGEQVGAVSRNRDHVGHEAEPAGRRRHRRQGDPGIAHAAPEVAVVPDAQRFPPRRLGGHRQLDDRSRLGVVAERHDLDPASHW